MAAQPPPRLLRDGILLCAVLVLGLIFLQQRLQNAARNKISADPDRRSAEANGLQPPAGDDDPDRPARPRAVGLTAMSAAPPAPPAVRQDVEDDPAKREQPPPPPDSGQESDAATGESAATDTTLAATAEDAAAAEAAGAAPPRQTEAMLAYHSALQAAIEAAAETMAQQNAEYSIADLAEIVVDALAANSVSNPGLPVLIIDGAGTVLAEVDAAGWWHLAGDGDRRTTGAPPAGLGPGSQMVTRVLQNPDGTSDVARTLYTQLPALNMLLMSALGPAPAPFDPPAVSP